MSKNLVVAMAITQAARLSFELTKEQQIDNRIWQSLFEDKEFIATVRHQLQNQAGMFRRPKNPSQEDFIDLRDEISPKLSHISRWPVVRALFLACEIESLLPEEVAEGFCTEIIEEILIDELGGL